MNTSSPGWWRNKRRKLTGLAHITLRQQLAYKVDFALRASFLLMILYVFVQLWSTAYGGDAGKTIAGFSLKQVIWYLVFTEAIVMASPPLSQRIEEEVKNGDIAIRLIRPLSYIGYHYATCMAEAVVRFAVHLAVGSLIAWSFTGAPDFGAGWPLMLTMVFGALTISFLLHAAIALCAFWVEETRGLEFVLNKLQFTVGGMLIPLDLMPEWLQKICVWLPFQAVLYAPARTAVQYEQAPLLEQYLTQAGWIVLLGGLVMFIYRRGVAKLHVNGG